ncbi:T9SS type A sorting domain-containing protein, partial [Calditrichota bacterium]
LSRNGITNSNQNCSSDSVLYATVILNGDTSAQQISYVQRNPAILIDANQFFDIVGGQYFPIGLNFGLTVQYGKIISFALNQYDYGFAALEKVEMLPPAETINFTIMALISFLARAIDGSVVFDNVNQSLDITIAPPSEIGDIVPEANDLANTLSLQNYTVQQGAINLVNAIELYTTGYQADCNGNNANYPYLWPQTPPCPDASFAPSIPLLYTMRPNEAFVLIGKTPPECMYYSYRSYLYNRYYPDIMPHRVKIFASLGDTQSLYNMSENRTVPNSFNRFFMLISAADNNTVTTIKNSALSAGILENDIYVDVMPIDTLHMGLGEKADLFSFLHRSVLFNDPNDHAQYVNNPPLEFLRISPIDPVAPDYFPFPVLRERGTDSTEFHLNDGLDQLRQQIINSYIADYDTINLPSYQWIPEGYVAIATRFNARGENRDALYLRTDFFQFNEDDIIVVFGANHAKTNKAVYCNAGILGAQARNGLGGVNSLKFGGTAQAFISDSVLADNFYVWKFARTQLDSQTYVIPPDSNDDYTGINYGATALMIFCSYVEPATKVGPDASELIMDQAILFRPKSTAVKKANELSPKDYLVSNIYPNPFNSSATIEFSLLENSLVSINIFNSLGENVTTLLNENMKAGKHEITWNAKDFASGIYMYKITAGKFTEIKKCILLK